MEAAKNAANEAADAVDDLVHHLYTADPSTVEEAVVANDSAAEPSVQQSLKVPLLLIDVMPEPVIDVAPIVPETPLAAPPTVPAESEGDKDQEIELLQVEEEIREAVALKEDITAVYAKIHLAMPLSAAGVEDDVISTSL